MLLVHATVYLGPLGKRGKAIKDFSEDHLELEICKKASMCIFIHFTIQRRWHFCVTNDGTSASQMMHHKNDMIKVFAFLQHLKNGKTKPTIGTRGGNLHSIGLNKNALLHKNVLLKM